MKRSTPLRRKTPLKRSRFRRSGPRRTDAPEHLAWLREQPCCVWALGLANDCHGVVQAHHSTVGRGLSRKTSDLDAMPLCERHHFCLHNYLGYFSGWTREERAEFQLARSAEYRAEMEKAG